MEQKRFQRNQSKMHKIVQREKRNDCFKKMEARMKTKRKKIIKGISAVLLLIVILVIALLAVLTIREYRPEAVEQLTTGTGSKQLNTGDSFSILTYNTGYAGLSKDEDFFMDGGKKVMPESKELVEQNMEGISSILKEQDADVYFLQEVDQDSKRSYHMNEAQYYEKELGIEGIFAYNFKCDYVPYPIPTIGKVNSGIMTVSDFVVSEASRIALPESFKWPVKTCNLKRCMLETRVPIEGSDKELVLINFHLEAYDSGEGKIAQSKMLAEKLEEEYKAGNYVIAGGDFNQTFPGINAYPIHDKEGWVPGEMSEEDLPDGFGFAVADNVPTCRLLNGSYSGNYEDSQVYVIDGFIVSDNVSVDEVKNVDVGFEYTDHQPVKLNVTLK